MIYLDNNATTRPAPEVVAAMLPYLGDLYANPSSAHGAGMAAKQAIGQARGSVASLIGAKSAEITFTASATEANHLAIQGTLRARPERRHVVTTAVEHPSSLALFQELVSQGYHVTVLPVDGEGRIRRHGPAAEVLDAELLTEVYGIRVEVDHDPHTGAVRTHPVGRHAPRAAAVPPALSDPR